MVECLYCRSTDYKILKFTSSNVGQMVMRSLNASFRLNLLRNRLFDVQLLVERFSHFFTLSSLKRESCRFGIVMAAIRTLIM